ncbi:unnamed protein product [Diatraea saccharalis]|uniref:Uncharacterized protein n=1 Tax=Diatraea saccharalis TaxID=40085 RepID=A0A9N9WEJ8_9NEOP|nr:unnamed protein product [Diatraea saccharalis]
MDNVTIRKPIKCNSLNDISDSSMFDATMMSLPDNTLNESQAFLDLNNKIVKLSTDLASAHQEIENLLDENNQLKTNLEHSQKLIGEYKKVQFSSTPSSVYSFGKRKRRCFSSELKGTKLILPLKSPSKEDIIGKSDTNNKYNEDHRKSDSQLYQATASDVKNSENINIPNLKKEESTRRIIIIADQQGKGLYYKLQGLLGSSYKVTSFLKPGAKLCDVLKSCNTEIAKLSSDDYIIVLGGTNDKNPYEFQSNLTLWLNSTKHTNVIVAGTRKLVTPIKPVYKTIFQYASPRSPLLRRSRACKRVIHPEKTVCIFLSVFSKQCSDRVQ